jgi:hypothetical protein
MFAINCTPLIIQVSLITPSWSWPCFICTGPTLFIPAFASLHSNQMKTVELLNVQLCTDEGGSTMRWMKFSL